MEEDGGEISEASLIEDDDDDLQRGTATGETGATGATGKGSGRGAATRNPLLRAVQPQPQDEEEEEEEEEEEMICDEDPGAEADGEFAGTGSGSAGGELVIDLPGEGLHDLFSCG